MTRTFERVGVVGLGTMGAGIAEVFARSGIAVVGVEVEPDALERGRGHLQRSTDRAVARGRLDAAAQAEIISRVELTTDRADCADCDLVVEAVPERLELKHEVTTSLDGICKPETVLATNTSSLSVTAIAAATARPDRVVGMHFFNPAPVMRLVEVISATTTASEVATDVADLARALGKTPVSVGDRAGFVANRLLFGYLNSAVLLLERGVPALEVDETMRRDAGLPMGPLALLDLIGLDTAVQILEVIHAESGNDRHDAAGMLRDLVGAGRLGRKSEAGFFSYADGTAGTDLPTPAHRSGSVGAMGQDPVRDGRVTAVDALLVPYLNDAMIMVGEGYASADEVDAAMTLGCGFPLGPIRQLDEFGLDRALAVLDTLQDAPSAYPGTAPAPLLRDLVGAGRVGRTAPGVRAGPGSD